MPSLGLQVWAEKGFEEASGNSQVQGIEQLYKQVGTLQYCWDEFPPEKSVPLVCRACSFLKRSLCSELALGERSVCELVL